MQGNSITTIAQGSFTGLTSLRTLDLSRNPAIAYAAPMFTGIATLDSIKLSHNNIQHDSLTPAIMTVLTNLTSIDLSNNNITRIVGGLFGGNRQLSNINLRNNGVHSIEYTFFEQFISAEVALSLEGNSCTNYNFLVLNRNYHKVRDELWDCFNNFSHAAGYNVPKYAIILLVVVKFLGLL